MSKLIIGACALLLCLGCEKTANAPAADKAAPAAGNKAKAGDKAKAKAGDKAKPAAKAPAKPAPAAMAWIKLDKLGVQLEMPAGAKAMPGAGESFMISGPADCTVMLGKKTDTVPYPSYDSTVKTIEKGITGKLKRMVKNEKTDDRNWVIQFEREGMIDPAKLKHGVDVRKVIGENEFSCSRVTNTADGAACVLKACQTLKAL